jgi:hypothetical protein
MAEGHVGLAFGVSGVFAIIDQCLTIYRHINRAPNFGENVWQQYVLFQHESARFDSWQKEMRDFGTLTSSQQQFARQHTQIDMPNADELMHSILAQVVGVLESVKKLCEKYMIYQLKNLGDTALKKPDADISTGLATTLIGSAIAYDGKLAASSLKKRQSEAFIKRNTSLFKRILYGATLWKDSDKHAFEMLVRKFTHWNDCLQHFLPDARRMMLDLASSSVILQTETEPEDLKEIQAAASYGLYESLARRAALKRENLSGDHKLSSKKDVKCLNEKEIRDVLSLSRGVVTFSDTGRGKSLLLMIKADRQRTHEVPR